MSTADVAGFDPAFYLATNPDIASAGYDPLEHYLRHGKQEGRPANQAEWAAKNGAAAQTNEQRLASPEAQAFAKNDPYAFDEAWYRKTYPNLGLGTGVDAAKQHYLQYGMQEGLSRNAFQAGGGYGQPINPAAGQFISAPQTAPSLDPNDPASWAAFRKQAAAETQGLNRLPYMAPNSATLSADPLSVQKQFYPAGNNYAYASPTQAPAGADATAAEASLAQLLQSMNGGAGVANLGMGGMAINPLPGVGYRR